MNRFKQKPKTPQEVFKIEHQEFHAFLAVHAPAFRFPILRGDELTNHRCDQYCLRFSNEAPSTTSWCIISHKPHHCTPTQCTHQERDGSAETYETCSITGRVHASIEYDSERSIYQSRSGDATLNTSSDSHFKLGKIYNFTSATVKDEYIYLVPKLARVIGMIVGRAGVTTSGTTTTTPIILNTIIHCLISKRIFESHWFKAIPATSKPSMNKISDIIRTKWKQITALFGETSNAELSTATT